MSVVNTNDPEVVEVLVRCVLLTSDACQPALELCQSITDHSPVVLSQEQLKDLNEALAKFQTTINTVYQVIQKTGNARILSEEALELLDELDTQD